MAYTSKNPKFDSTVFTDIGAGTPVNPAAGSVKLLVRSGAFYVRDSAGSEVTIANPPDATPSQSGVVNITQQSFGGLKKFESGLIDCSGVNFVVGDTVLTNADRRSQAFIVGSPITLQLPATGVKAGEIWTFYNGANNSLQLVADDTTPLDFATLVSNGTVTSGRLEKQGSIVVQSLIDAPATNTDWRVLQVIEHGTWTSTASGIFGSLDFPKYFRINNRVQVSGHLGTGTIAGLTNDVGSFTLPHPVVFTDFRDLAGTAITLSTTDTKSFNMRALEVFAGTGGSSNLMFVSVYNNNATSESVSGNVEATYTLVGY